MNPFRRPISLHLTDSGLLLQVPGRPSRHVPLAQVASGDAKFEAWSAALSSVVSSEGLAKRPTRVTYAGTSSTALVTSTPGRSSTAQRHRAALLAHSEAIGADLGEVPHALNTLWTDPARGDDPASTHVLSVSEQPAVLDRVLACVRASGLNPVGAVPEPAADVLAAASLARATRGGSATFVLLWIGDSTSVLVACQDSRLALVRTVPIGVNSFCDAVVRACHAKDPRQQVSPEQARSILGALWESESELAGTHGYVRRDFLPALAPLHQRLSLEIKQTARFGLAPAFRAACVLRVAVQRTTPALLLADLVASSGVAPEAGATHEGQAPDAWTLALIPVPEARARATRSARLLVRAGVAAAFLAAGVDTAFSLNFAERVSALRSSLAATVDSSATDEAALRLAQLQQALGRAHAYVPAQVPAAGMLAAIARCTPPEIHLTRLELETNDTASVIQLSGIVPQSNPDCLQSLTTRLADLPGTASVRLGEVVRLDDARGLEFHITLTLQSTPTPGAAAAPIAEAAP